MPLQHEGQAVGKGAAISSAIKGAYRAKFAKGILSEFKLFVLCALQAMKQKALVNRLQAKCHQKGPECAWHLG